MVAFPWGSLSGCGPAPSGSRSVGQIRYAEIMAKVVDPQNLPDPKVCIPGLKPPVLEFVACDDSDPAEADAFNSMIRELRNQNPASAGT